jgi:hypothetical protein
MARTTLDIELPILQELKALQRREDKTLGELVSELLADALGRRKAAASKSRPKFRWYTQSLGAKVDLEDKEAVRAILDADLRFR